MRFSSAVPVLVFTAAALAACGPTQHELDALAAASQSADSLADVRKELFDEVIASTQFVTDINKELNKGRVLAIGLESGGETDKTVQRRQIVGRIKTLVARLDTVQARVSSMRAQAQLTSQKDSALVAQVAAFQESITELQQAAETQQVQLQAVIDQKTMQIASLTGQVTTLRTTLVDTVGKLTAEKNAAYYVIGTKEELIKKGVLVAEGQKRFVVAGSRTVVPARKLDPSVFTKIDRVMERTITLPEGSYEILSRQNHNLVIPQAAKDGKIVGGLTIEQPEQFWETSPFLIIVRQ